VTTAVAVLWAGLGLYWLIAAAGAKRGTGRGRGFPPGLLAVIAFVVVRAFRPDSLDVHSVAIRSVGLILLVAGMAVAVWARIYLGRNWGMPMTEKAEPELVTTGPYGLVRHPIYSGLLLALLGTALATNLYWLIGVGIIGIYFIYSARVEERLMTASFPAVYPAYRARTKMLIPFVL
jgi:protein-S-isoprenylcysteine O-methyltransferase Ste14